MSTFPVFIGMDLKSDDRKWSKHELIESINSVLSLIEDDCLDTACVEELSLLFRSILKSRVDSDCEPGKITRNPSAGLVEVLSLANTTTQNQRDGRCLPHQDTQAWENY